MKRSALTSKICLTGRVPLLACHPRWPPVNTFDKWLRNKLLNYLVCRPPHQPSLVSRSFSVVVRQCWPAPLTSNPASLLIKVKSGHLQFIWRRLTGRLRARHWRLLAMPDTMSAPPRRRPPALPGRQSASPNGLCLHHLKDCLHRLTNCLHGF